MQTLTKCFLYLAVITAPLQSKAQDYCAYTDYLGRFFIFDKGKSIQVDHLKPQSYQIGANSVVYISSNGHLMQYRDDRPIPLEKVSPSEYYATDYLVAYAIYEKLKTVYNNQVLELSRSCSDYAVGDSVIAFYDQFIKSLNIFYNGQTYELESGLIGFPLQSWIIGDNTFAYITKRNNEFKIWQNGVLHSIDKNIGNVKFKAGKNIVAYTNPLDQSFNVFQNGESKIIDDFLPESFQTGNEFVAYVDYNGEFKIYKNGVTNTISSYTPETYLAKDNMLVFIEDNYFKCWFNNKVVEIEPYKPQVFKIDWNTIAYLDHTNRIYKFQNGEKEYISNEFVERFEVYRDLIHMEIKHDKNLIYHKGKLYNGSTLIK